DALKFVDENDAGRGMIFDGRIAEDFKLNTGTWVSVGNLRAQMIAAGKGLIQDVVITGHDNEFIGAIVFPGIDYCKKMTGLNKEVKPDELILLPALKETLLGVLNELAKKSTGSATFIRRAMFADFVLSIDKGEITDKGSVNQRMVLQNHPETVKKLYAAQTSKDIVEVKK
ncbi:MAG: hypothetical protein SFU87_15280, partial [Chitinophagaceae bacterium]|nr:hypothetical protein [Chitinophagaceae bacterium]